jgi:hypothetical protein
MIYNGFSADNTMYLLITSFIAGDYPGKGSSAAALDSAAEVSSNCMPAVLCTHAGN